MGDATAVSEPDAHRDVARMLGQLREAGASLSVAESLTGGRLAAEITAVPGASAVFRGGVVAYASEVKVSVLGVDRELVARHGVVSAQCALSMAAGVRRLLGSTWGVATTGVAGPDGQEGKPVGLVYVAVVGPETSDVHEGRWHGTREQIQGRAVREAWHLLGRVAIG